MDGLGVGQIPSALCGDAIEFNFQYVLYPNDKAAYREPSTKARLLV